jgi:hypothetical protein
MRDGGQGDFETEAAEVERQAEALAQVTATLQAARERLAEDGDASQVDRGGQ